MEGAGMKLKAKVTKLSWFDSDVSLAKVGVKTQNV